MAEPKTKPTHVNVEEFLKKVEPQQKQDDAFTLLEMFKKITGEKPVMWGPTMVGFGVFHYKSERSSQEGDWLRTGFSPRKQSLTLYVITSETDPNLLKKLGKHTTGVSCLYINKLADVDINIVGKLIQDTWDYMEKKYPTTKN
jgi:hypothetical protein